jgi:hypothetical protein
MSKDQHTTAYPFKQKVENILHRVCQRLESLLSTSPVIPMLLFSATAHPLMFITEVVGNCNESLIEYLSGDAKKQRQLIDVIFSWFGITARSGTYPLLVGHLDTWKDIKEQRRHDIQRIQVVLPDFITIHLVSIDKSQQEIYNGKLVSFDSSTPTTEEHPIVHTRLSDHYIVQGSCTEVNAIDLHAIVDINTFPLPLQEKKDKRTHRLRFTDFRSSDWVQSTWLLALSIYGAMDTTMERSTEAINMIQTQLMERTASNRIAKVQLGKSVSISQAQPNQRRFIDAPRNIPSRRHKDSGKGLAIPLNEHTPIVRNLWAYALNSLEGIVPSLVNHWREELFASGFHLQDASAFVACGFVLEGYAASVHVDYRDPHFTAGFRLARFEYERPGDNQLFFPELIPLNSQKMGIVVTQSQGTITLYQGGTLMHTNSITDHANQSKLCAHGIALVQKQQLTSYRKNEHLHSQQNWQVMEEQWKLRKFF